MASIGEAPRFILQPHAESPRRARELVGDALDSRVDKETREDAAVVVSELVTNAVIHAGTTVAVRIHLLDAGGVRLEVADSRSWPPVPRQLVPDSVGGRGLVLVQALADSWGVDATPDGKVVWAEIEPAGRPSESFAPKGSG